MSHVTNAHVHSEDTQCMQYNDNKLLSYRRQTALQGALVLAKSRRLELGDNICGQYRSMIDLYCISQEKSIIGLQDLFTLDKNNRQQEVIR